jgi:hypothetical protein
LGTYFSVYSIEGYDALYNKRYGEFISSAADGTIGPLQRSVVLLDRQGRYSETILELLGVRYLVHRTSDGHNVWAYPYWKYPQYASVYKDDTYEVFENTNAYPRVFLASSYAVETDRDLILSSLFAESINRRDTLILEKAPVLIPERGPGDATILKYEPTEVLIRVDSSTPKLLFLSDVYDSGWVASVDGVHAEVYRADYAFRAVSVAGGVHTVKFEYRPKSLATSIRIAIGALVLLGIGIIRKFV